MKLISEFDPHARIHLIEDCEAIYLQWNKLFMTQGQWMDILKEAIAIGKANGFSTWIADMYNSEGIFSPEVISYWKTSGMDLVKKNGFKQVLTVNPKHISTSDRSWKVPFNENSPLQLIEFPNLEKLKNWIKFKVPMKKSPFIPVP